MRYFTSLSYQGTNYSGWQIQKNANTVQEEIEKALSTLLKEEISITGAGRTDSGVHAQNYIIHFDSISVKDFNDLFFLVYKINAILPKDIVIHKIWEVADDAHARFDAKLREYKYYIHTLKDPFSSSFSYQYNFKIDIEKMNIAAKFLLGKQDFTSLEKLHGSNTNSICEIFKAEWECLSPNHYVFTVQANRFLRNMVRAMVGSLLEVGRGKRSPEWMQEMLDQKDRNAAGNSVPSNALMLTKIEY